MIRIPIIRSKQSNSSITIGIVSAVLSSICQSIGLILQRKSHLHYGNKSKCRYKPPYKRSLWRTGFILFLVSNILGSSIQITTLPLIILSPLQSITLVFNSLFSSLILHEIFTLNSLIGTILVCLGAFLIATFGRLPEPEYNLDQFIVFLQRRKFIIWVVFNLIIVITLLVQIILSINVDLFIKGDENEGDCDLIANESNDYSISAMSIGHQQDRSIEESPVRRDQEEESLMLDNDNYVHSTASNEYEYFRQGEFNDDYRIKRFIKDQMDKGKKILTKINLKICRIILKLTLKNSNLLQGVFFGSISGILSAFSLLLAKSTIEILINCITSKPGFQNFLNRPMMWIIIFFFLLLCLLHLWFLNKGLKLITTSILYPLVFCIYNIVNIGNELIFFNQWENITLWQFLNISVGTMLVLIGVMLLSWRLDDPDETINVLESPTTSTTPLLRNDPIYPSNHYHHHSHKRNFSFESNSTNKRVGLSSILHSHVTTKNKKTLKKLQQGFSPSLESTPIFKSYFSFNNNNKHNNNNNNNNTNNKNNNNSFNHNNNRNNDNNNNTTSSQKTPTRSKIKLLSITTSLNDEDDYEEGHSEYISFGSPNNKNSPSTTESVMHQELLLSPLSNTRKQSQIFNSTSTPTKLKFDINGFQNTDIEDDSLLSFPGNTEINSNQTTPTRIYGSIGNIFGASQQQQQQQPLSPHQQLESSQEHHNHHHTTLQSQQNRQRAHSTSGKKNSRLVLSFEQNQLLGQFQN